jgi:hypothetical protein
VYSTNRGQKINILARVKAGEGPRVPTSLSSPVTAATHLYSDEPIVRPTPTTPITTTEQIVEEATPVEASIVEDASAVVRC